MPDLNVFDNDAFSTLELIGALEKVPYVPQYLGGLDLFEPVPVRTTAVSLEKRNNVLTLVGTTPRGAPIPQRANDSRDIRDVDTVRIAKGDRLNSSELQNVRDFGVISKDLEDAQDEVLRRFINLRRDIDLTFEYHRLGAVQGQVLDADGTTVIIDWFNFWGISQPAEVNFDLDNAAPASGVVRKTCQGIVRGIQRVANGAWTPGVSSIIGLCGDAFFDDLTAHPETRSTFLQQAEASELRKGNAFSTLSFGGIDFVNYRGTDDNSTVAIANDKVKFVPVNAPGVFLQAMAPGESIDTVNTLGRPLYPLIVRDTDRDMWVDMELYSYPLFICTRPEMLLRGKRT